jgi:hypothetical protein
MFNGLATLSLTLFVLALALWVRSYFVLDGIGFAHNFRNASGRVTVVEVGSNRGVVQVIIYWYPSTLTMSRTGTGLEIFHNPPNPYRKTYVGFYYGPIGALSLLISQEIFFPYWFLSIFFLAMPFHWLRSRLRAEINKGMICSNCGYDLRATPDRCPECGTIPQSLKNIQTEAPYNSRG